MQIVNTASGYALGILFPILGAAAVLGRFLSRRRRRAGYGWDDWLTLPALVITTACGAVMITGAATNTIGAHNAPSPAVESLFLDTPQQALFLKLHSQKLYGRHSQETSGRHPADSLAKLEVAFLLLSYWAIGFIRLAFLFLFRRIFRGKTFAIANWCLIGLVCAWTITFFIGYFTACRNNIASYWGPLADLKGKCADTFALLSVMCVTDFAVDLCVLVLPLVCVWQLNMKSTMKVGVSMVFLLGIFSVAISLARMVFMLQILTYPFGTDQPLFGTAGTSDPIGVISVIIWWTMLEIGIGMITCNLPVLPGLLRNTSIGGFCNRVWQSVASRTMSMRRLRSEGTSFSSSAVDKEQRRASQMSTHSTAESLEKGLHEVRVSTTINVTHSLQQAPAQAPTEDTAVDSRW